ncbi:hypothetical protein [Nocardia iowensis]|uniref:TrbL/VirB6 plasmid conjugal transfer protein n=1 Tax=Nocardia iowensis TaxID=204891 RepID=A0ABX8RY40_NOCIO|nr:hypothetical protein [Nocardia iowensis]QXN94584.1 hypothetical protein KV110_16950 [Nocardia iowensis]
MTSPDHLGNYARTGEPLRAQIELPGVCDLPLGPQQACESLGEAVTGAASLVFEDMVTALGNGLAGGLRLLMTWWTAIPSPQLTSSDGTPGAALVGIRDYTSGLQVVLLTAGILFAAARLAMAKRGGTAGEAQESFLMLARAVFASMTVAAVITAGTRAGDRFAAWVISDASRGDLNSAVGNLIEFDLKQGSSLGSGLLLVLFLLGIISTLVQVVMLVIRQALLILVVAVLPIAAAASGTGPGSQSYKKLLSWSLAFMLWKPVGALVYALAFTVAGRDPQDPQLVLLGLILLVMTVVVLPALMRLVAPAVATLGGGGGAGAAIAGGLAGVAMATAGSGGRSEGRKVAEGENSPGAGGGPPPSPPPPGGGGGGGRPMSGGSSGDGGGGAGPGGGPGPGGGGPSGGGAPPAGGGGAKTPDATSADRGGAAVAAGAGPAAMAGQAVKSAGEHSVSAVEGQARDATESGGLDPDALGPGEVRR